MDVTANAFWIPLLAAAAAAVIAWVAIALIQRRGFKREVLEADLGLRLVHELKWRELSQLLLRALRMRGYEPSGTPHVAGEGGYDLLVQRGSERYLVQCKHGGSHMVGAGPVRDLLNAIADHDASGAILVTTGRFGDDAQAAARHRPIQLLDGAPLWRDLKPFLAASLLSDVNRSMAAILRQRRIAQTAMIVLVAALAFAGAMVWQPSSLTAAKTASEPAVTPPPQREPTPTPTPASAAPKPIATPAPSPKPVSTPPATPVPVVSAPAPAPPPPVAAAPPATVAPAVTPAAPPVAHVAPSPTKPAPLRELSGAEELERRIAALADVRKIAGVMGSDWSSKSTLVVALNANTDETRAPVVAAVCAAVVAYEELRFTRLQINDASATRESEKRVHWHQCK